MLSSIKEKRPAASIEQAGRRKKRRDSFTGVKESGFSDLLMQTVDEPARLEKPENSQKYESINEMLEELYDFEQNLLRYPNESNYHAYKKKVRQISSVLLGQAYELKVLRDRSRREFEIIKTIDRNLHDVFQNLMSHNPDLTSVLRTLGDIRGILLDLQV